MQFLELTQVLQKFGKYVVQQSRTRLTKAGKGKGNLYNSLGYDVNESKLNTKLAFKAIGYAEFVDKGVKGANPSKVSPNAKITGQQAPNSPYRFGSGRVPGTWNKFVTSIASWAKARNIRLRDEKGRFTKGNYKTIANIIAGNIYNRGLKPTMFFTAPYRNALQKFDQPFAAAIAQDIAQQVSLLAKQIKTNKK